MTDKLRAAAQNALDVLEHIQRCIGFDKATIHRDSDTWEQADKATDALREALAECPDGQKQPNYDQVTSVPQSRNSAGYNFSEPVDFQDRSRDGRNAPASNTDTGGWWACADE